MHVYINIYIYIYIFITPRMDRGAPKGRASARGGRGGALGS